MRANIALQYPICSPACLLESANMACTMLPLRRKTLRGSMQKIYFEKRPEIYFAKRPENIFRKESQKDPEDVKETGRIPLRAPRTP